MRARLWKFDALASVFLPLPLFFVNWGLGSWISWRRTTAADRAQAREFRRTSETLRADQRALRGEPAPTTVAVRCIVAVALFGGLIAIDYALVRWLFDDNYLAWYLANGALITLAFAIISAAVGLDAIPELISRNPYVYLGGLLTLISLVSASWATMLRVESPAERMRAGELSSLAPTGWPFRAVALLDLLLAVLLQQALVLLLLGWLLFVMPLQYFLNLVCGAAARMALESRTIAVYDPGKHEATSGIPKETELPKGVLRLGYAERPVTFTASVGAGALWVLNRLV